MKQIKYNYKNLTMCSLYVLFSVLCGSLMLSGCGADKASDGIILELSREAASGAENQEKIQADTEAHLLLSDETAEGSEKEAEQKNTDGINTGEKNTGTVNTGAEDTQTVYVYLCGAVASPGVYQLKQGSRLYEAVELAGGLTREADAACLNLARQITDGEQIVILTCEEAEQLKQEGKYAFGQENAATASNTPSGLVNINTASVSELTTVSGIGESRAQAIVAYREANGGFRCIEDIKKVEGIKEGLFSKIKDKITV